MQEQYNKQQEQQQNTTAQSAQFQTNKKEKVGDYIDYEEIN